MAVVLERAPSNSRYSRLIARTARASSSSEKRVPKSTGLRPPSFTPSTRPSLCSGIQRCSPSGCIASEVSGHLYVGLRVAPCRRRPARTPVAELQAGIWASILYEWGDPKHRPAGFPFVQSHAPQSDHVLCLRVRLRERGTGLCSCCRCRRPVSVHLVAPARVLVTRAGTGTSQPDGAHESRRQGRFPAAPGRLPGAPSYQQFLEVRVGATPLLPARRCVRPSAGHGCGFQSSSEGERQEGLLPSRL